MAREDGSVNARLEAWLGVQTTAGETLDCLVDTGFDGALVLPRAVVRRLGLSILGRVPIAWVSGTRAVADVAEVEIEWLGARLPVEVVVSEGDDSLLGTGLLDGTRLLIDYVTHTVTVSG